MEPNERKIRALRAEIEEQLGADPDLGKSGIRYREIGNERHEANRQDMLTDESVREYFRARQFLMRYLPPLKNAYRYCASSYELKHFAERAMGRYVSNGALIAAARHLVFPEQVVGPNTRIGITNRVRRDQR